MSTMEGVTTELLADNLIIKDPSNYRTFNSTLDDLYNLYTKYTNDYLPIKMFKDLVTDGLDINEKEVTQNITFYNDINQFHLLFSYGIGKFKISILIKVDTDKFKEDKYMEQKAFDDIPNGSLIKKFVESMTIKEQRYIINDEDFFDMVAISPKKFIQYLKTHHSPQAFNKEISYTEQVENTLYAWLKNTRILDSCSEITCDDLKLAEQLHDTDMYYCKSKQPNVYTLIHVKESIPCQVSFIKHKIITLTGICRPANKYYTYDKPNDGIKLKRLFGTYKICKVPFCTNDVKSKYLFMKIPIRSSTGSQIKSLLKHRLLIKDNYLYMEILTIIVNKSSKVFECADLSKLNISPNYYNNNQMPSNVKSPSNVQLEYKYGIYLNGMLSFNLNGIELK